MTRAGPPESNNEPQPDSLSDQAAGNTLALNPLIGLRGKDLMDSAAILLRARRTASSLTTLFIPSSGGLTGSQRSVVMWA